MKNLISIIALILLGVGASAQTPLWAFNIGSNITATATAGTDQAFNCKIAANGNLYVTGKFGGTMDMDPGPGVYNVTSNGQTDIFLACYSPAGAFLWGFNVGGTGYDGGFGVATDLASNVIITGFFQGGADFDPSGATAILPFMGGTTSPGEGDGFVAKYNSGGGFMWGKDLGGTTVFDYAEGVEVDGANNIYVGGEFLGTMVVSPTITFNSAVAGNGYLIKYDPLGNVIWGHNMGEAAASSDCVVRSIKVRNSSLYICGVFKGTGDFDTWSTPQVLTAAGGPSATDGFVAKYDTAANFQWINQVSGDGLADELGGLVLDNSENVYVAGWGNSASFMFNPADPPSSTISAPGGGGNMDIVMAKYNSFGTFLWAHVIGGTGNDMNRKGIDVSGGNLFITGQMQNAVDFDPSGSSAVFSSWGMYDLYFAKYDLDGNYQCAFTTGSAAYDDIGYGLTHDASGKIYTCGQFGGTSVDFNPAPAIFPLTTVGGNDSYIGKYDPACVLLDCSNAIDMPDTLSICVDDTMTIPASLSGLDSVMTIHWSPASGLSSTTIINPVVTATTAGYKYVEVKSLLRINLVVNGDFSGGNTGFTSSYVYAAPPSTTLVEGNYSVYTNPNGVHTGFTVMGDHTTGTGNMMIVNGASSGADIWCQTITVTPNTDYDFSAWFANCSAVTTGTDVPIMQFKINGVLIGTPTTVSSAPGTWVNFATTWNSGTSTTATICIYDGTTAASGNDFVIDDIAFRKICTLDDSIYIAPALPDTTFNVWDTAVCSNILPIIIAGPTGYDSYLWNTGGTANLISISTTGQYWVRAALGCHIEIDTFNFTVNPNPTVMLGSDTAFCIGNTYIIGTVQPAGSTYLWSNGATTDTIHVSSTGSYTLRVTSPEGCSDSDAVNITVSPFPVVDLGPDTFSCSGLPILLYSSGSYTAPQFLWQNGSIGPTYTATMSGTYWLQVTDGGCSAADTIHVVIKYDTFTLYNNDTAICKGQSVSVLMTYNPEISFQWLPTAGMPVSDIPGPVITPDTSDMYVVTARIPGCPDLLDSFYIDVQPNPVPILEHTRRICEGDTIHVNLAVDPRWYTHYSYSWSPAAEVDHPDEASIVYTGVANTTLVVTVSTPHGCVGTDSVLVGVSPIGFASISGDTSVCPRDSVQLIAAGGVSYTWSPAMYLSSTTAAAPWAFPETSETYTVVAWSIDGCRDTLSVKVQVYPGAVINMPDSVTLYPGETYQMDPKTNGSKFLWVPSGGLTDKYIANPIAAPIADTRYILNATTEHGCAVSDTILVYVNPNTLILMPNAFSPVNGQFKVSKRGIAHLDYFRIYNRWGNLVYDGNNIDEGWDGTYKGVPQQMDVFVYTIQAVTLTGTVITKTGNVTLIR